MCDKTFKTNQNRENLKRSVYFRENKGTSICGANKRACN